MNLRIARTYYVLMRKLMFVLACFASLMFSQDSYAASDAEVIRGFNLTVFGAEFAPLGIQTKYIRKFSGQVRLKIHNLSKKNRTAQIKRFVRMLNSSVKGLQISVTNRSANFNLYVVDRADYVKVARQKVYKRPTAKVPGKCLVRSVFSRNGIIRSDAIIVSDNGNALFQRCMTEEILQGLGPLNEHPSLRESMFNDRTKHTKFTRFDRLIVNMLYDSRVKNGTSLKNVQAILPDVLRDAKKRNR